MGGGGEIARSTTGVVDALPWIIPPVIADVLVFVLAIIFIKFRPQGLLSAKGV